jgi:hypothetical protein
MAKAMANARPRACEDCGQWEGGVIARAIRFVLGVAWIIGSMTAMFWLCDWGVDDGIARPGIADDLRGALTVFGLMVGAMSVVVGFAMALMPDERCRDGGG